MSRKRNAAKRRKREARRGAASSGASHRWRAGIGAALVLVTLALFAPAREHAFLGFDDDLHVTANAAVQQGLSWDGLAWALRTTQTANWYPVTWLSHMLDVELFGVDAGAQHGVNVALHAVNALLLFLVLASATGATWRSALVAALFAWHPLRVESVAWIAERKDVLSTLFWLLTTLAWLGWVRRGGAGRYALVVLGLALGLMTKPMLVTLPLVLLLLDLWPLKRWPAAGDGGSAGQGRALAALVAEKLPLFALVAVSSAFTVWAQTAGGAVKSIESVPIASRLANAALAVVTYLRQTVWPVDLAVFYPYGREVAAWQVVLAGVAIAALTVLASWAWRSRPWLTVGWLWYLGTLVPVLGLVQVGAQAHADRYTYVPSIGLFVVVAWGLGELAARRPGLRSPLAAAAAAALAACAVLTARQLSHWKTTETLFAHALTVTRGNWMAHEHLGLALADRGDHEAAIPHFEAALRFLPPAALPFGHENLAASLLARGELDAAVGHFREAVRLRPEYAEAHTNLGIALAYRGEWEAALPHQSEAVRLAPDDAAIRANLAKALEATGPGDKAELQYREVIRLRPDDPAAHEALGDALQRAARFDEAAEAYRESLRLAPRRIRSHIYLGLALEAAGRGDEAEGSYRTALAIDPRQTAARDGLARVLAAAGGVTKQPPVESSSRGFRRPRPPR